MAKSLITLESLYIALKGFHLDLELSDCFSLMGAVKSDRCIDRFGFFIFAENIIKILLGQRLPAFRHFLAIDEQKAFQLFSN